MDPLHWDMGQHVIVHIKCVFEGYIILTYCMLKPNQIKSLIIVVHSRVEEILDTKKKCSKYVIEQSEL